MPSRDFYLSFALFLLAASSASAGHIYEVTAKDGDKSVTYQVQFGGTERRDRFTAFDPESKKFVYREWDRNGKPPVPAMKIWDHRTGETIPLYDFPDAKKPLSVIPSIKEIKVCPITGDKEFKASVVIAVD